MTCDPKQCDLIRTLTDTLRWVRLMIRPQREGGHRDWKTIDFVCKTEIEKVERMSQCEQ